MLKIRAALLGLSLLGLTSLSPAADPKPAPIEQKSPEIKQATAEDAKNLFNGKDLTGWWGDLSLWHVENGELVGKTENGLHRNEFLKSAVSVGDFRFTCQIK